MRRWTMFATLTATTAALASTEHSSEKTGEECRGACAITASSDAVRAVGRKPRLTRKIQLGFS